MQQRPAYASKRGAKHAAGVQQTAATTALVGCMPQADCSWSRCVGLTIMLHQHPDGAYDGCKGHQVGDKKPEARPAQGSALPLAVCAEGTPAGAGWCFAEAAAPRPCHIPPAADAAAARGVLLLVTGTRGLPARRHQTPVVGAMGPCHRGKLQLLTCRSLHRQRDRSPGGRPWWQRCRTEVCKWCSGLAAATACLCA